MHADCQAIRRIESGNAPLPAGRFHAAWCISAIFVDSPLLPLELYDRTSDEMTLDEVERITNPLSETSNVCLIRRSPQVSEEW
jgi:hypothetical protein